MFVGHYGVSFAAKRGDDSIPLWVLFVAVQLLDVVWAPLILLGVEKMRIVPGFTATNPLGRWLSVSYSRKTRGRVTWKSGCALA